MEISRRPARSAAGVATALGLWVCLGSGAGCSSPQPLTEQDCQAVAQVLAEAWRADANDAVTVAQTDQFRRFVADESKSVAERWMTSCRQQIGRSVDPSELACLRRAKRIEDVGRCATRYGESDGT
jgi:hypothetical protein